MDSIIYDVIIYLIFFIIKCKRVFQVMAFFFFYKIMFYLGQVEIIQSPDQVSYIRIIQKY